MLERARTVLDLVNDLVHPITIEAHPASNGSSRPRGAPPHKGSVPYKILRKSEMHGTACKRPSLGACSERRTYFTGIRRSPEGQGPSNSGEIGPESHRSTQRRAFAFGSMHTNANLQKTYFYAWSQILKYRACLCTHWGYPCILINVTLHNMYSYSTR